MIKYTSKLYLKDVSAHNRALARPMHNIRFAGEAWGTSTGDIWFKSGKAYDAASLQRRQILWASWKGQITNKLPNDLSNYSVMVKGKRIIFTPMSERDGWVDKVAITLPDWEVADDPVETIVEQRP